MHKSTMDLARRSIQSSLTNVVSHGLQVVILFIRSILLARALSPEVFGVYAFAQSIIALTITLPTFGLGSAYTHRSAESDHPDSLGVYLTLISVFSLIWAVVLIGVAALVMDYERFWVLAILVIVSLVPQFVAPAQTMLAKKVSFSRLALLGLLDAMLSTLVSLLLARSGAGVWSLLGVNIAHAVLMFTGLYVVKPVWRPRLAWSRPVARYFLRFGSTSLFAGLLVQAIDRVDDLWTGQFLGDAALGFYSRAYAFANYPRRILATPLNSVALATYAEVKLDRRRLSEAFFRVNALLVRAGFLFAGSLFLVSPEFVRLALGEQWLPMLDAFRLMLAYTFADPIKFTVGHLFTSVGQPGLLVRTRLLQFVILIVGLVVLGPRWGIVGVALAATIMVVFGMTVLLWQARIYVDYSPVRLFGVPAGALTVGMAAAQLIYKAWAYSQPFWIGAMAKLLVFVTIYSAAVLIAERKQIQELLQLVRRVFSRIGTVATPGSQVGGGTPPLQND